MFFTMLMLTIILILITAIAVIIMIVSKKSLVDNQKTTPFECGFSPMSYSRIPFSIHFFLIAAIFLIFDIEIILVMPLIMTMKTSLVFNWIYTTVLFTLILLFGLLHEWKNGMIEWTDNT
uniref:NADH-ubiquinone oxidoreductase chain 3 n=1 Tax=Cicadellidae sp. EMHAU-2015-Zz052706 TaxID=2037760 RepID=A0A2U7NV25_9HEMI|nr:NADH dehydrogenase subunit 3 [Cicadellidae sp. EMHAU-2015-Zz052706]